MEAEHLFVEDFRDAMVANRWMAWSMNVKRLSVVDLVYHLGPAELISEIDDAIARSSKHFIILENEFPVLPDLSTWEVPPTIFELVPNKGLSRSPKGCPQSSRIHNEIDFKEKSDGKLCGVYRLLGHNRNKCCSETTILDNRHDQIEIDMLFITC
ncbi:hypothetical protein GOBAR_AA01651 [Gossypium barbadense]|uniref:Uncharacterized protein n=1 Tax=Gossypium barbadense TaxID=3634 RepID=A0A2P5YTK5_GOSBA|nr:hypothetical protein GOBAR_AA01651 [Gossypium barbadense]